MIAVEVGSDDTLFVMQSVVGHLANDNDVQMLRALLRSNVVFCASGAAVFGLNSAQNAILSTLALNRINDSGKEKEAAWLEECLLAFISVSVAKKASIESGMITASERSGDHEKRPADELVIRV